MNRPQNITVHDGVLSLVARREATPITCGSKDSRFPAGRDYTSAHLSTKGLHEWTYGKFEMRAKLPTQADTSKGMWPALWMRPTSGGTGEIDIMEAIGSDATGVDYDRVHQTIWHDYTGTPKQAKLVPLAGNARPSDGMHTYAVEWTPTSITWLVDGAVTYERTTQTTTWFTDAFTKPFYLRLNLAVGGTWPGSPTDATSFPASYDVDYVRVYQH